VSSCAQSSEWGSSTMTNENDSNTPTANAQGEPPRQPPVIPPAPTQGEVGPNPDDRPHNQQDTARELAREFRWVEITSLMINGALALIGVVALCIYHGQLATMNGQLAEMQEARKQAKIDNAQAITAQQKIAQDSLTKSQDNFEESSRSAQQTFRDDQRAWIVAVGVDPPDPPFAEGKQPRFSVAITNSGKTPAMKVRPQVAAWPYLKGQTFVPVYTDDPAGLVHSTTIVSPGLRPVLKTSPLVIPLKQPGLDMVKAGSIIYYIYGKIAYEDVSKRSHITTFCFFLNPDLTAYGACETYNEAD
jgi:hypothetical protein